MIVSEARREANRRNALRSTGPKTEAGKSRSRRNALDHGLAAEVVLHPDDGAPAGPAPAPGGTAFDAWLAGEITLTTRRLDRCRRSEALLREEAAVRARDLWEDDRRAEAEAIGAGLAADPAGVVSRLRLTPQGCDWLIARWLLVAGASGRSGLGSGPVEAASDLLGIPAPLRAEIPGRAVDPSTLALAPPYPLPVLVRREVDALRKQKDRVAGVDALARELALADLRDEPTPELRKLRRYEATLHKRLRWCLDQLPEEATDHLDLPEPAADPGPADPLPPGPAAPETEPEPEPGADQAPILPPRRAMPVEPARPESDDAPRRNEAILPRPDRRLL